MGLECASNEYVDSRLDLTHSIRHDMAEAILLRSAVTMVPFYPINWHSFFYLLLHFDINVEEVLVSHVEGSYCLPLALISPNKL